MGSWMDGEGMGERQTRRVKEGVAKEREGDGEREMENGRGREKRREGNEDREREQWERKGE